MRILPKLIKTLMTFTITIFTLSILHWILIYIYVNYCIDLSLYGIIKNVVSLGSPVCNFINHIQLELNKQYTSFWLSSVITVTTFIVSFLKF